MCPCSSSCQSMSDTTVAVDGNTMTLIRDFFTLITLTTWNIINFATEAMQCTIPALQSTSHTDACHRHPLGVLITGSAHQGTFSVCTKLLLSSQEGPGDEQQVLWYLRSYYGVPAANTQYLLSQVPYWLCFLPTEQLVNLKQPVTGPGPEKCLH